jgi:hypothetical protein
MTAGELLKAVEGGDVLQVEAILSMNPTLDVNTTLARVRYRETYRDPDELLENALND